MQQETARPLALDPVEPLGVRRGSEGDGDERLRLAPGEQGGAVCPREHADLAADVADLVERATIQAAATLQDLLAKRHVL